MTISRILRLSIFPSVVLIAVILLPSLLRAQSFEGEIMMQMTSPMMGPQKMDMTYSIKGNKVLQTADDPKQGKISVFTDTKSGTQTIVMVAQKQGMQFDQASIDSVIKKMDLPKYEPTAAGKKDKIAGFNCELYTMMVDTSRKQEMNIWLTKDFPKDVSSAIGMCVEAGMKTTGIKSDALMALFKSGYAPVRIEMKADGVTQLTNEYAKLERKKLDDAIFIIPSDIIVKKFDPSLMSGKAEGK